MSDSKPGVRPVIPHFSSGPCAKRPGWSLQALTDAVAGAFAPSQDRQGEAQARHRSDARGAGSPRRLPHRHRAGLRYRRGGDGAVVAAGRAARHHAHLGKLRRRLGHRRRKAAETEGRHGPQSALWRIARPRQGRFCQRRGVHLERHHLGRARAERRLDRGRPRRPHDLRRHLGGLRAEARLGKARCRHLLLAEGAGRRGRRTAC